MSALFEELDYRPTPIGAVSLRRRKELRLGSDVFEIKLGDEFLMSSLFTAFEIAGAAGAGGARRRRSHSQATVFTDARAEEVTFHNPLQDKPFTQTVCLGQRRA